MKLIIKEMTLACHLVLTRDLAKLYECINCKDVNKAVNSNIERFTNGFYF